MKDFGDELHRGRSRRIVRCDVYFQMKLAILKRRMFFPLVELKMFVYQVRQDRLQLYLAGCLRC